VIVAGPGHATRHVDDPALPSTEATDPIGGAVRCRATPPLSPHPRLQAAAGPTVKQALSSARKDGSIGSSDYTRYRDDYSAGRAALGKLSDPTRHAQQKAVLDTLETIAGRGQLTGSRMPSLFLTLRRNTEYWTSGKPLPLTPPPPAGQKKPCAGASGQGGARVEFEGDPVIFQWYPGRGLQIQQLANFGKANGLYQRCKDPTPDPANPCDRDALKAMLDRMADIASKRGGRTAWEYYFEFGGGQPPWASGLAQGTAIQAYARGYDLLGDPRYKSIGHDALGIFEQAPPTGVRVAADGGSHYLIYSFSPGLRVLNGFLQGVTGLYDFGQLTGDADAKRLFAAGDRAARKEIPRFDTGNWSLYNQNGHESDLGYHRLVRDFLSNLCDRTKVGVYCKTAARFTAYQHQRVKLIVTAPKKVIRAKKTYTFAFSVSKVSCTTLNVIRNPKPPAPPTPPVTTPPTPPPGTSAAAAPTTVLTRQAVLGHGGHTVQWTPAKAGNYMVQVVAIDLNGHRKKIEARFQVK
jgi:hypothetical protein